MKLKKERNILRGYYQLMDKFYSSDFIILNNDTK